MLVFVVMLIPNYQGPTPWCTPQQTS